MCGVARYSHDFFFQFHFHSFILFTTLPVFTPKSFLLAHKTIKYRQAQAHGTYTIQSVSNNILLYFILCDYVIFRFFVVVIVVVVEKKTHHTNIGTEQKIPLYYLHFLLAYTLLAHTHIFHTYITLSWNPFGVCVDSSRVCVRVSTVNNKSLFVCCMLPKLFDCSTWANTFRSSYTQHSTAQHNMCVLCIHTHPFVHFRFFFVYFHLAVFDWVCVNFVCVSLFNRQWEWQKFPFSVVFLLFLLLLLIWEAIFLTLAVDSFPFLPCSVSSWHIYSGVSFCFCCRVERQLWMKQMEVLHTSFWMAANKSVDYRNET